MQTEEQEKREFDSRLACVRSRIERLTPSRRLGERTNSERLGLFSKVSWDAVVETCS